MKKRICGSLICGMLFVLLLITLFFSASIERILRFKPDFSMIDEGALEVHFIDVGQGDCVAIKLPDNKTILVDSGPISGKDNLEEYLTKVFFDDGYNRFDYVFLTHSDIDHSGNMEYILDNFEIGSFYRPRIYSSSLEVNKSGFKVDNDVYDEILISLTNKNITTYFATNNAVLNIGSAQIEMFVSTMSHEEANDYSPFLIISANNSKVCLSGDAGEDVEKEIIDRGCLSEVDLMKLAHHGSKYSNTMELIEVLSPKFVVCSVGENSHGHPASDVLLRLANFDELNNSSIYETFKTTLKHGNIIYYSNPNSEMDVKVVGSLGNYLFIDWYGVVIIGECCVLLYYILIIVPNKPVKFNKYIKNMKQ